MWRSDGFEMLQYEGKTKKYHCCNPPVAHSTCYKGVTFPCAMAKESVNLQKNNTKSFISIFLIIMKIFTRLISVFLLVAIGSLFFFSCAEKEKCTPMVSFLETALQQAGENRVELEKVLSHYKTDPADSLKYKAACFLIENMPYYTYYKGKQLDRYLTYYTLLQETRGLGISPQVVADSVCHMYGALYLDSLQSYRDIETVDSAYLCNNIEWSFKVWQEQPWGKHVSFADFCEYLLPYRIGDETLTSWRESIYQKYNPLLDSLRASGVLDK